MKSFRSLSIFGIVCVFLVGYQFMGAAVWAPPSVAPPGGNTSAPIDVGPVTQQKDGNLQAERLAASDQMRSPKYCDSLGDNCFDPTDVASERTCDAGQFIRGIKADGTLICAPDGVSVAPPPTGPSCYSQTFQASRCSGSMPGNICGTGNTPIGSAQYTGISCSSVMYGSGHRYTQLCSKKVCS